MPSSDFHFIAFKLNVGVVNYKGIKNASPVCALLMPPYSWVKLDVGKEPLS